MRIYIHTYIHTYRQTDMHNDLKVYVLSMYKLTYLPRYLPVRMEPSACCSSNLGRCKDKPLVPRV